MTVIFLEYQTNTTFQTNLKTSSAQKNLGNQAELAALVMD